MRKKRKIYIFLIFIISFLFYFVVGTLVHEVGFWSLREIYLVEKALLATRGEPAGFETVGLTYPSLPFILLFSPVFLGAHFQAGVLLSSVYGAITLLFFSSLVKTKVGLFSVFFIFVHPLFLYAYSGGGSIGLFLFLISLFTYFHKRFLESGEEDIFSLFMSSIFLGFSVLVRYETVFFIFPVVFTLILDQNPWRLASKPIVFLFPTLFIFGGLIYINWMYRDDPFYFVHSHFLQTKLLESGGTMFKNFLFPLFLFPSYVVSVWSIRKKMRPLILLLSPLIVPLISAWVLGTAPPLSYFCLLGVGSLIFLEQSKGLVKRMFLPASIIGLLVGFGLPERVMWGEEREFTGFLIYKNTGEIFKEEREVANYLKQLDGKVFFDDTYNYPIVFFHGDPRAFVLPYEFEFNFYIRSPYAVSRYVLISNPRGEKDLVSQNNKDIFFQKDPRWKLVKEIGDWRLFESRDFMLRRGKN